MYHEASPSSNMKMPKIKPIFQLLKPNYICSPQGIPSGIYRCIVSIHLLQQGGICIFIAQGLVLLSHFWFNLLLCVYVHRLGPMEVTCSLPINHGFIGVPTTIHNSNNIPIGLSIIGHEAFEIWIGNTFH
jgi:hypothetical protein